jgi:hypothetical protein
MSTKIRRGIAVASSALIGLSTAAVGVGAHASASPAPSNPSPSVSTSYSPANSPFSLTISPTRLVVTPKGIAKAQQILVVNRGETTVPVTVQKRNFTGNRDGSLQFQPQASYSASDWVTVHPTTFSLLPGASRSVTATITMPTAPEPGDHQVALVFLVPAGHTGANIRINRGVATPIYIAVPGPTNDSAKVTKFDAPGFATGGPIRVTATVRNTGTVHRDFRGNGALDVLGAGSTTFPDFTVMRGATRDISTTWNPPVMCICHPKITIVNADGTTHTMTIRVIVFPVVLAGILLGALLLLILVIVLSRRRYRANVVRAAAALSSASRGDG